MFKGGSFLWLLGQEGRILWRGSILLRSRRYVLVPVVVVAVVFQSVALILAALIVKNPIARPEMILVANLNLFFFSFLMLSRAMSAAIDVLYGRGDVDFLLASPIPPGRVLAVRMLGVALTVASPWLLLGGVLANGLVVFGDVWALAIYPMLLAVGILAAAAAFVMVVLLVGVVSPGRARGLGNFMALAMGVLIFGLGQAPRFIAPEAMRRLWQSVMPAGDASGLAWVPGKAFLGEPADLALFLAFTAAVFGLVWVSLAGKFGAGAISAAAYRPGGKPPRRQGQFKESAFAALFVKNLRLLLRFPGLVTQTVYRSLTLVPVVMILAGRVKIGAGPEVVAPLLVFLAGQLGLFFISVMAGTDQSPELAASAPVAVARVRRGALWAAGYAALVLMALPVIGVLAREAVVLPALLAGMAGVLLSNLAVGLRLPIPLTRAQFGKAQTGTVMGLILGVTVSSFWAVLVWVWVTPDPLGVFLR
jgi:ABC-2 type transport system permease protein